MPLIDLKTDLKSLKFGKDRPGGGSSNQPYIQKAIPEGDPSNIFNTGGPDFLLRGGLLAPVRAANDVSRLTQMFFDLKSPNGLLFTATENLLSRTAVKTEATEGAAYGGGGINAGVYTPLNTIGQAASGFSGTHLNLLGLPNNEINKYEDVIKEKNQAARFATKEISIPLKIKNPNYTPPKLILGSELNPIPSIEPEFITVQKTKIVPTDDSDFDNRLVNLWKDKQSIYNESPNILEYDGGPGSILGIGKTNIKFADQRTGVNNFLYSNNFGFWGGQDEEGRIYLSPQSKEIEPKLGATIRASLLIPNSRPESWSEENLLVNNKITSKYRVLDRNNEELSNSIKKSTQTLDGTQEGGIRINYSNAISADGVSNLYNTLVEPIGGSELDNKYTDKNFFNVYDPNITPGNTWPKNTPLQKANGSLTYNQIQLIDANPISKGGELQDFRRDLIGTPSSPFTDSSTIMSLAPNYVTSGRNNRTNSGDPGKSNTKNGTKNVLNYGIPASTMEALDKITAMPMYDGVGPDTSKAINDLVKFRIAAINNDKDNGSAVYMHFRAFIDSFQDNYNANWNSTNYLGRGESFFTYGNFGRGIQMNFTIYAQSKPELIPMYKKLNYLASTLSPDYTSAGFMRGNLVRLTMGGYLYEQPGFISSLSYDIPQESTWEIALDEKGGADSSVKELPHMIRVQMSFTPIHTFLPQKPNTANNPNERYIALANASNDRGNYADEYKFYNKSSTVDTTG